MRFYRNAFWAAALLHLAIAGWFCLAPDTVRNIFGHPETMPLIFFQVSGLVFFIQACGFGFMAERPESVPAGYLVTLGKVLLPFFAWSAWRRGELSGMHFAFQGTIDLVLLPLLISYFFWYTHAPRPNRFMPLMGIFGESKKKR